MYSECSRPGNSDHNTLPFSSVEFKCLFLSVTRVRSHGEIMVTFNVMMKDFAKLGYDCGAPSKVPYLGAPPPPQTVTVPREGQSDA